MEKIRRKFLEALKAQNTSEIIEQMDKDGELEKIFPHIIEMKKIGKCRISCCRQLYPFNECFKRA